MRITISDVEMVDGEVFVYFKSAAGQAFAKWMNSEYPRLNYCYDVELDTDKSISESVTEGFIDMPRDNLSMQGDVVFMYGALESIEDDGMAYLRLSPDALVMIESGEKRFSAGESVLLKFEKSEIEVTALGS